MPLEKFSASGRIQWQWKNSVPLEEFSGSGKIQCHWKNSSVPLEEFSAIGRIQWNWKVGGKSAGPPGPAQTPKNRNFFGDSQMIGGLFRAENQVRLASKKILEPAGPNKK